jgi:hypothetical protein
VIASGQILISGVFCGHPPPAEKAEARLSYFPAAVLNGITFMLREAM